MGIKEVKAINTRIDDICHTNPNSFSTYHPNIDSDLKTLDKRQARDHSFSLGQMDVMNGHMNLMSSHMSHMYEHMYERLDGRMDCMDDNLKEIRGELNQLHKLVHKKK